VTVVVVALALLGVLVLGLIVGLVWRGTVIISDRRALNRLGRQFTAEQRMEAATRLTLQRMREAAVRPDLRRPNPWDGRS